MGEKDRKGGLWGRLRERFGDVARRLGFVAHEDVEEALDRQKERKAARRPHKKIGRILVEGGKMAAAHVGDVLKEQEKRKADGATTGKKGTKNATKPAAKKASGKAAGKKTGGKGKQKAARKVAGKKTKKKPRK